MVYDTTDVIWSFQVINPKINPFMTSILQNVKLLHTTQNWKKIVLLRKSKKMSKITTRQN